MVRSVPLRGSRAAPRSKLAALILCAACGPSIPPSLTLEAQPPEIPADGLSSTVIKITAQESGGRAVPDGTSVQLVTTAGSFDKDDREVTETSKSVTAGSAPVTLYAPVEPADAVVTGSFSAQSGRDVNGTVNVKFREPTLAGRLVFNCASRNIGALVGGIADLLEVPCTAKAFDSTDVEITRPHIQFLAEAGKVLWVEDEFTHERLVVYRPRAGGSEPVDVEPLGSEPKWSDPNAGGRVRNPRDGVAALVAWVRGVPPGGRDALGEPFLDVDDDGQWDATEPYHDCNGNLHYDAASGQELSKACIWRTFKVVWSEKSCWGSPCPVALASRIDLSQPIVPCDPNAPVDVTIHLLDQNLNALSANDPNDELSIDFDGPGAHIPSPLLNLAMKQTGGMFFESTGVEGYLEKVRNSNQASGYGLDTEYASQIVSDRPQGATSPFTIGVHLTRTLGPPFQGRTAPDLTRENTPVAHGQIAGTCL